MRNNIVMDASHYPKVGVGFLIIKDNEILLGKRKSSHGVGEYALPGGHLEYMETFEECALREFAEEVGSDMKLKNVRYLCTTNLMKYAPKHYVDIGMCAEWESGEPIVMEPEKLESWDWYPINDLPQPLFGCTDNYLLAYQTGQHYFAKT